MQSLAEQSLRYNQSQTYFLTLGCHQGMYPVLHGLFWYPFGPIYLCKKGRTTGGRLFASFAGILRNPSWKINGYQVQSSDPNCTCKPFGGKNPTYKFHFLISYYCRQAGRKKHFFHNPSFHPGISTYFKKQEYEAYLLVASSIDFYNRALWVKPLQGGKVQSRSLPFPAASKRSNPSLTSKDTKPKYSWG